MDSFSRMWKFDANANKLEMVKKMQGHLDSVKNVAMKGDLGYISTSSRVIFSMEILIKMFFLHRMELVEFGREKIWSLK